MGAPISMRKAALGAPRGLWASRYSQRATDRNLSLDTILAAGDYILKHDAVESDAPKEPRSAEVIWLYR